MNSDQNRAPQKSENGFYYLCTILLQFIAYNGCSMSNKLKCLISQGLPLIMELLIKFHIFLKFSEVQVYDEVKNK